MQEYETVSITLEGSVNDKEVKTTEYTNKVGASSISFTPEQLKKYKGESISAKITRKALIPVSEGTKEGGVMSIYYDGNFVTTDVTGNLHL